MLATVGVLAGLLLGAPSNVRDQEALQAEAERANSTWKTCLSQQDAELRALKITPERYEMALSGQCLSEEDALKSSYEKLLMSGMDVRWPEHLQVQFLEGNRGKAERAPDGYRKKLRSAYTIWYVQTVRPSS